MEARMAYEKLRTAINKGDTNYLKSILRHDQKFSQALFMDITGKKLPSSTRDIQTFLDDMFKNESLKESKLTKKSVNGIDNRVLNDIRDGYYDMSDAIHTLKYAYMDASQKNKDWENEYKIFKKIQELHAQLETGKIL